jgi:hypothetical protein
MQALHGIGQEALLLLTRIKISSYIQSAAHSNHMISLDRFEFYFDKGKPMLK